MIPMASYGWRIVDRRAVAHSFTGTNKYCSCHASADRGSVHSRATSDAGMETKPSWFLIPEDCHAEKYHKAKVCANDQRRGYTIDHTIWRTSE
jgi:hypothetical protein